MKLLTGKELARLLEQHGWSLQRGKGSPHVYIKPGNPARISVPVHGNAILKKGLLHHLLKLAGVLIGLNKCCQLYDNLAVKICKNLNIPKLDSIH
ncbi:MAG TPA: type II toxin-antitoxin system HicA family toxin [Magnetococcales bacterium]|nr:type II toxin-antitoxin system HicA family toxin [Magnetococcales bacterium]